jgi:hypothetical protein
LAGDLFLPADTAPAGFVGSGVSAAELAAAGWLWWHQHQPQRLKPALAVLLHDMGMSAVFCNCRCVADHGSLWVLQSAFLAWRARNACEQSCV